MNEQVAKIRAEIERMLTYDESISTAYYIGKRDAERELKAFIDSLPGEPATIRKDKLLKWATEQYEKAMSFVSGNPEADHARQLTLLGIVKHFEEL